MLAQTNLGLGMQSEFSDRKYAISTAVVIGLFTAFQLGFPYITYALAMATGCARVSGACGAVGAIIPMVLKPLGILAIVVALGVIGIGRCRSLGFPRLYGLLAPGLLLADMPFHTLFGSFWGYAFAVGALTMPVPTMTVAALAVVVALGLMPKEGAGPAALRIPAPIVWSIPTLAGTALVLGLLTSFLRWGQLLIHLQMVVTALLVLALCVAVRFARARRDEATSERAIAPDPSVGPAAGLFREVRWVPLAVAAFVLSCVVVTNTFDSGMPYITIPMMLFPVIIPTAALYLAVLVSLNLLVVRRSASALLLVALSLAPFLLWHLERAHHLGLVEQSIDEARAVPTMKLDRVPDAALVGVNGDGTGGLLERPEIRYVFRQDGSLSWEQGKPVYLAMDDQAGERQNFRDAKVMELPAEYLEFRSRHDSEYRTKGITEHGPFELVHVAPEGRSLVALQYQARYMGPSDLPALSIGMFGGMGAGMAGWVRKNGAMMSSDIDRNEKAFIDRAFESLGER